ncbi:MAG: hypothetical protein HYS55_05115 [Candidatus Omnitrophica bacterium]|nr:hypothetical protein [Candidatus Omnitrophota bacterium]
MSTIQYVSRTIFRICLIVLCASAVYTKMAFGQSGPSAAPNGWQPLSHLPIQGHAEFVAIHPKNPNALFIGAQGNLYASFNHGKDWKQLIGLGTNATIHELYFDKNRVFLLTSQGLFESKNEGKNWKQVFRGNKLESNVLSLRQDANNPSVFYLGTEGGLFQSRDGGRTWPKETNELAHQHIRRLEIDPDTNELFIASDRGLYRMIPDKRSFERIYITNTPEEIEESDFDVANELEIELSPDEERVQSITLAREPLSIVAIGTPNGVWFSEDEGNHWERLSLNGLLDTQIIDVAYSSKLGTFLAATEKGIFFYHARDKRWHHFPDNFPKIRINRMTLSSASDEILYAATSEGVYQIILAPEWMEAKHMLSFSEERWNLALTLFQKEPSIRTIQKETIKYANVSHWKTRRWQWASRFRALIPSFSVGKSFSKGDTLDLDRGSTNDPDRYIMGPPDTNRSWDFDLNWELSDLIWNTAQTSIDSREKLMVELRDDILSEATRLYFERRRAQVEFILTPPQDILSQTHALLRIDELTASIDALTNGFLTKELNQLYEKHPECNELWSIKAEE